MKRFVARANIARFLNLLERETDPEERRVIEDLLAAEEQKLREANSEVPAEAPKQLRDAAE
jgi:hypothetical protein